MDTITSSHVSVVLEDAINQLDILRCLKSRSSTPDYEVIGNSLSSDTSRDFERVVLRNLLEKTNCEILEKNTYDVLTNFIHEESSNNAFLENTKSRNENDQNVEQLMLKIQNLKLQKEEKSQNHKYVCAHLKDLIQEMKFKFKTEEAYALKSAEVDVNMVRKKCQIEEDICTQLLEEMKLKLEDENHINAEMTSFLRNYTEKLKDKLRAWSEKCEIDIMEKQGELDALKASRAKDAEKFKELLRNYHECEKVVVEDRVEKEKMKLKLQMERKHHQAAIKIQCWWRGMMVRNHLGPHKTKTKKKKAVQSKNNKPVKSTKQR